MKVEYIREADAPVPPKATSKRVQELHTALAGLPAGQVIRATLTDGQTMRGLKTSLARVARTQQFAIGTWEVAEQPDVLYVRKRRGR